MQKMLHIASGFAKLVYVSFKKYMIQM